MIFVLCLREKTNTPNKKQMKPKEVDFVFYNFEDPRTPLGFFQKNIF